MSERPLDKIIGGINAVEQAKLREIAEKEAAEQKLADDLRDLCVDLRDLFVQSGVEPTEQISTRYTHIERKRFMREKVYEHIPTDIIICEGWHIASIRVKQQDYHGYSYIDKKDYYLSKDGLLFRVINSNEIVAGFEEIAKQMRANPKYNNWDRNDPFKDFMMDVTPTVQKLTSKEN